MKSRRGPAGQCWIEMNEDDCWFILDTLMAHAGSNGFTKELWKAIDGLWPDDKGEAF